MPDDMTVVLGKVSAFPADPERAAIRLVPAGIWQGETVYALAADPALIAAASEAAEGQDDALAAITALTVEIQGLRQQIADVTVEKSGKKYIRVGTTSLLSLGVSL